MNLSPGTNPGGLILLRIIIEMMWPVSHSCKAMHNVCGIQLSRSVLMHACSTACEHSHMAEVYCIQHTSVQLELFRRAGGCQNLTLTIFTRPRMCSVRMPKFDTHHLHEASHVLCQNLTLTIFTRPRMCSVNPPDNKVTIVFRLALS